MQALNRTIQAILFVCSVFSLSVTPVSASLLYQNPVETGINNGSCLFNTSCSLPYFVATEFTLGTVSTIDSVSFFAWSEDIVPGTPTGVNWIILNDDESVPGPGPEFASGDNFSYSLGPPIVGTNFTAYEYLVDIPDLAGLSTGSYWLAFQLISDDGGTYWTNGQNSAPSFFGPGSDNNWSVGLNPPNPAIAVYGSPSAVPIPAAVWLFGTSLAGLVGFSRHRKVA